MYCRVVDFKFGGSLLKKVETLIFFQNSKKMCTRVVIPIYTILSRINSKNSNIMCTQILVPTYTFIWGQIFSYVGLSTHVGISNFDFKQLVGSTVVQPSYTILGPTNSSSIIIYVLCLIILSLYDSCICLLYLQVPVDLTRTLSLSWTYCMMYEYRYGLSISRLRAYYIRRYSTTKYLDKSVPVPLALTTD